MNNGWIRLHRQITEHDYWTAETFTRGQAWIDLLLLANHKDSTVFIRGNEIQVPRGCVCRAETTLAKRWSWSRDKVRRFLTALESRQQIRQQKSTVISLIEVINYDEYQANDTTDKTTDKTTEKQQTRQQKNTYKKNKNDKNEKKPSSEGAPEQGPGVVAVVSIEEGGGEQVYELAALLTEVLGCRKMVNPLARKKYATRLNTYTHEELMKAIANLRNEPDQWKIKNLAAKPLSWWLRNDDYIEELLNLHLKRGRNQGTFIQL